VYNGCGVDARIVGQAGPDVEGMVDGGVENCGCVAHPPGRDVDVDVVMVQKVR
jgi:hypothetical protein